MSQAFAYAVAAGLSGSCPPLAAPPLQGRRDRAGPGRLGRRHAGVQPHRRPAAGARRRPGGRRGRDRDRRVRPRDTGMQVAAQRTGHNAEPLGDAGRRDPRQDRRAPGRRDRRRAPDRARRAPARSGATSSRRRPSSGSRRCTGRPPTSASPATRWAAASAGTRASSGSRRTASPRSSSSPPTAGSAASTPTTTPTCSGRCAAAAATSASSPRSRSQLYSIPDIYAGVLFFPWERSSEVLHAWLEWTATVPDEVTSVGRILQFPPIAGDPRAAARRQVRRSSRPSYMGDEASGASCCSRSATLGPAMDTFAMVPPAGIAELHMDPPQPGAVHRRRARCSAPLDGEAIDRFVAAAGPESGSPLVSAEIRHVGGALSRPQPHHGALSTFDADVPDLRRRDGAGRGDVPRRTARSSTSCAEALAPVRQRPRST